MNDGIDGPICQCGETMDLYHGVRLCPHCDQACTGTKYCPTCGRYQAEVRIRVEREMYKEEHS